MLKEKFNSLYPNFDYNTLCKVVAAIGNDLNTPSERFEKGTLFEKALTRAFGGAVERINVKGCDLQDTKNSIKFEVKTMKNCLYTNKGNLKKGNTSSIKLTNTLQQRENKTLSVTADYLIIIDTSHAAMAIISYGDVVSKYSREKKDGFTCQVPMKKLSLLMEKDDSVKVSTTVEYSKIKDKYQNEYIDSFFLGEE